MGRGSPRDDYVIMCGGEKSMGLVKTRRLAAMQKQQRAKAGMKPPIKGGAGKGVPRQFAAAPKSPLRVF